MSDRKPIILRGLLSVVVLFLFSAAFAGAESDVKLSRGETVYISTYSNVFVGSAKEKFQLSVLLSIRNTDPKYTVTITKVDYYNTDGRNIKTYVYNPVTLRPLASKYFFVEPQDDKGGEGANFLVKWQAEHAVNQPIIEAVMSNLYNRQGLAFRCPGKIITEHRE